jgi:hypothetical protein
MRSIVVAIIVAVSLPMIDTYGIFLTNALCAVLVWISFRYVFVSEKQTPRVFADSEDLFKSGLYYIIKYGDEMRAWVDIGFSTIEDNSKPVDRPSSPESTPLISV